MMVVSWQNQTNPIRLCWNYDADNQFTLSTQALILSFEITSVANSQSHVVEQW